MSCSIPERFSAACLLSAPVERTSSFLKGSVLGPQALVEELDRIDSFDSDVGAGLKEIPFLRHELSCDQATVLNAAVADVSAEVSRQLDEGHFVLTLGSEHTTTLGPVRAVSARCKSLGVVQLDAHGDLRDRFEEREISHACVMRRVASDLGLPVLGLGVRSMCREEADYLETCHNVTHVGPRELGNGMRAVDEALAAMPEQVYLTVDVDVFDPSVAPGVGTPEPGGLDWHQVSGLIDLVAERKRIVGADIVEFAPNIEKERTVRLVARVAIRVLLRSMLRQQPRR